MDGGCQGLEWVEESWICWVRTLVLWGALVLQVRYLLRASCHIPGTDFLYSATHLPTRFVPEMRY